MAKEKDKAVANNTYSFDDDDEQQSDSRMIDSLHNTPRGVLMRDAPLTGTPQQVEASTPFTAGSGSSSRPLTRSMWRTMFGDANVFTPPANSRLFERFKRLSTRGNSIPTHSNLEEAPDIQYGPDHAEEESPETAVQTQSSGTTLSLTGHPQVGQLRVPVRRSARIQGHTAPARESTPSMMLASTSLEVERVHKKAKKELPVRDQQGRFTRRSTDMTKPLLEFHMYSKLPDEIKIMIWEAAIIPRITYICNRSSVSHSVVPFGRQNKLPSWFMACRLSVWVAQRYYRKMFALHGPGNEIYNLPRQDINPDVDIVVFEPCHNGCRGYHCARHQYCDADRTRVRLLAIQTESRHLAPTTEPCWQTISRSWPNVETLYLMRVAIKGVDNGDKALIRVKETEDELELKKRFLQWKKGLGEKMKMTKMEFVVVADRETEQKQLEDRYREIPERQTGRPEDIVLG
ncbi:hypothetical protein F4779DRAFT_617490 [Xylariaceae sp. FL0662B]|nr:hypothetical protein F4779DRAFT_617490 [Xylariaceae sp. FL0662B]